MNYKLGIIITILSLVFFSSCTKENLDLTDPQLEEVEVSVIDCAELLVDIEYLDPSNPEEKLNSLVEGGTAPYSYQWSNGENTSAIIPTLSGNYSLEVTDSNGCISENSITITILHKPEILGSPVTLYVECDGQGNEQEFNFWLLENKAIEVTSYCGATTWSHEIQSVPMGCSGTGAYNVLFTVTDECGNFSTMEANYFIEDNTAPFISTQAEDEFVQCDGTGNLAQYQNWLSINGGAVATDNCSQINWNYVVDQTTGSADCIGDQVFELTFTATDECNNASTTKAYFTIGEQ